MTFTITRKFGIYYLCDGDIYGKFDTLQAAIDAAYEIADGILPLSITYR